MMVAAEKLARRLRLSGFFGLDFIIEKTSRKPYLIEMNPRCTPLCHLRLGKGKDMPAAMWARLSGQPVKEAPPDTACDIIGYFPQPLNGKNVLLESNFLDAPKNEPELANELLNPWPDRTLSFRAYEQLRCLVSSVSGRESFQREQLQKYYPNTKTEN